MASIDRRMWTSLSASVGGTSKNLDDVVCYSLRKSRFQRASHFHLSFQPSGILDDVLDSDQVKERKFDVILDLNQHIQIAVWSGIAARARTEDGETCNATLSQCGFKPAKAC